VKYQFFVYSFADEIKYFFKEKDKEE